MCVYIYIYRCGTLEMYKDVGDSLYHLGLGYAFVGVRNKRVCKGMRSDTEE